MKSDSTPLAEPDILWAAPLSDSEIDELAHQEPLPPNQVFQLPAEEQPIETQPTYINTCQT